MKRAAKQVLIVLLVVMAVIGTGNISAQADYNWKPKKVSIAQSAKKVSQGKEFEIRAKVTPIDAEDDYIRWEIISGKKYVKFEDRDRTGDEMDFIAVKPGKAKIRCYVQGKSKKKYGDTITVTVTKKKSDYSLAKVGESVKYVEAWDDFDLEVKKGSSKNNSQLKLEISDTSIVSFAERKTTGTDVEFYAEKTGTVRVTCTCTSGKAKGKKVVYTVNVIADDDDDYDDDDYYDDDYYDDYD